MVTIPVMISRAAVVSVCRSNDTPISGTIIGRRIVACRVAAIICGRVVIIRGSIVIAVIRRCVTAIIAVTGAVSVGA
jgi:hypothetical protein